jgi:hypothetical protein
MWPEVGGIAAAAAAISRGKRRLSRAEKQLWREVVQRFKADHFHGSVVVLEAFCGAVAMSRSLSHPIMPYRPVTTLVFGPYTTIYNRFNRWSRQGVWTAFSTR